MAEDLGGKNFHGGVRHVGGNEMGADACGIELFEEIDGHPEVDVADTFDGQTD